MAHMTTRMTRWLDSHDSLARWLAVCQDTLGQRYIFQIKMAVCVAVIGKEVFRFILGDYENLFFSIEDMPILL